jgi:hypothetical protein
MAAPSSGLALVGVAFGGFCIDHSGANAAWSPTASIMPGR